MLALRMHSPKVLLRTKSDLQASQLGCPLVVHLCQCAAVQDEFAEADVAAPAAAGELQVVDQGFVMFDFMHIVHIFLHNLNIS